MSSVNTDRFVAVRTNRGYEVRDMLWNAIPSRKNDIVIVEDSLCHNLATARLFARKYSQEWQAVMDGAQPTRIHGSHGRIYKAPRSLFNELAI